MNKKLCTVLHLVYHALFGSTMYVAGSGYLEEFRAIRGEIRYQSERITTEVAKLQTGVNTADQSFKNLGKVGSDIQKATKKLEKVCKWR